MEKETERITKSLAIVERQINELKDSGNKTALDILRKKEARLKEELKGTQMTTNALAKNLLAQRKNIKGLSKIEFNDLIRRLSKRPEYSFLKTMPKDQIKNDLQVTAKPIGWRFKGRGNYDKPTAKQIIAGKKSGRVYNERRPLHSDVSQVVKLKNGGNVDLFQDYNNIPKNVSSILEKYTAEFGDDFGAMDFADIKKMQKEVEAKGYTFDYDMDGSIYGLRPINVPLNHLEGYEDEYKDGGNIDDYISKNKFLHNPIDEKEVLEEATFKVNAIKNGKSSATSESIKEDLNEHKMSLYKLDIGTLKPARIIGTGYRGNTRKIANTWLLKQIAICEKAIELLKQPTANKTKATSLAFSIKKHSKEIIDLMIEEIAQLTNTRPIAVKKFLEQHNLTEKQISAITVGLGRKQIKPQAFANAIVGDKTYEKAIIKFAKSNEAFKNPNMSIKETLNRDVKLYIELNMKAEGSFSVEVRMAQLIIASLRDSNYHDRAYEFAKLIDPKLKSEQQFYKSDLINPTPSDSDIATHIAEMSDYQFMDIIEAYEYFLKDKNFIKISIALKQLINPKKSNSKDYTTEVVQWADKLYRVEINFAKNPTKTLNDVWKEKSDAISFAENLAEKNNGTYLGSKDWNKTSNQLKDASYISNRDIISLTIKRGSDTITINGNDILDGVYLKNTTKMEQGGNIGRKISFTDWRGDVRTGVITEKLKRGYEVMTPQGVALVEDSEIIE